MNHIYRTVWNKALGAMVAVAEIAPSGGGATGGSAPRRKRVALSADLAVPPDAAKLADLNRLAHLSVLSLGVAIAWGGLVASAHAQTLPQGGVAIQGTAALNYSQLNKLTVTTTNGAGTGHSAINWNSFNIGAGATTQFVQPSAASLSINRVVTNTPSQLFGTLSSNGKIVLVNQSGIAVGAGAVVDTAGFTASAVGMSALDAIAGRLRFAGSELGNHTGALRVDGNIIARGGDVVLIAPSIDLAKTAVVESQGGSVALAAGQSVEITGRGLEGITLHVQAPSDQAINLGSLKGDAVGIFAGTLRHSGMIQAVTADRVGGNVVLRATGDAYVEGQGQIVATSAAAGAKGGSVDVFGNRVAIADQAMIDVSGQGGGGNIRVGGDFQGKNADVPNAQKTYFGPNATLKADALDAGDGGRVIVWADEQTRGHGSISARGGPNGGDGGFVEVSGKHRLAFDATVNTLAPRGKTGTLLLDPDYIDVAIGGVAALNTVDQFADFGTTVTIAPATINAAATNVMLQANEDITFTDPVNMVNLGVGLTALAGGLIYVQAPITTNQGNITLYAGHPSAGGSQPSGSALYVQAAINSNGGNITLRSDGSDVGGNSLQLTSGAIVNAGAGTLILQSVGSVEQFAGSSITAAVLDVSADYTIDLNQPGNSITSNANFSSNLLTGSGTLFAFRNSAPAFNLSGAVSRGNLGFSITTTGSMTTDGVLQSAGNMSITAPGGIGFGDDVVVAGALTLNSATGGGTIQQTGGGMTVSGATSVSTGTGMVNLQSLFNDFSTMSISSGHKLVKDVNALNVLSSTVNAPNSTFLFDVGGVLTLPAGNINTGTAQAYLRSAGALTTPGTVTGTDVVLQSTSGALTIAHNVTSNGTSLYLGAGGAGAITQTAGSIVTGAGVTTQAVAGTGDVNLNQVGNDFSTIAMTGGALSVFDSNSLAVGLLANGANKGISITALGSSLALPVANINVGSGNLSINTGSFLTTQGTISGNNMSFSAAGGLQFTDNVSATGTVTINTSVGNGSISQSGGAFAVAGATSVSAGTGSIDLSRSLNDFSSISLSGGTTVKASDNNAMQVTALNLNTPNATVDLQAGGFLTLPASAINTGTGSLSLLSGTFLQTNGALQGGDVFLQSNSGLMNLSHNVTASNNLSIAANGGAITQLGGSSVSVGGVTTAFATGNINLNAAANAFVGIVNISTGNSATLTAQSPVQLGTVNAGSNLTVSAFNQVISQAGGTSITVGGVTTLDAGNNDINLFNANNNFNTVSATGRSIGLVDVNAMNVTSLSNPGAINLYLEAGGLLTLPPATDLAASFQLSLFSGAGGGGGALTTTGNISAPTVTLAAHNDLTLAHNVNATVLDLSSASGNINQTGGAIIATLVQNAAASSGFVSLNQPLNDINSISATAAGAITINDSGAAGIGHLNMTGDSVSITAVGPILRHGGTITSTSGPITLTGSSIGISGGPLSDFVALNPGGGIVNLTATTGGIAVNQVAGDMDFSGYTVSATGAAQDLKFNLDTTGGVANICFCGFNASTQDDRIFVTTQGVNADINVQSNLSATALQLNFGTQGATSHVNFTGGGANVQAVGGFNINSFQGSVSVGGNITNFTGPLTIQAANVVAGTGGVQAVGQDINIAAGRNSGGFVSDGSGAIALAFVNSAGSNGFNSASPLIANGQNGGNISLLLDAGSTGLIQVATIDSRGGNGATLTTSGSGALGGNGGNIAIQGDGGTTSVPGGNIFSSGGRGGDASVPGMPGGTGGSGGQVDVSTLNLGNLLFMGNIASRGGDGGNAVAGGTAAAGGAGGSAGDINLVANGSLTFIGGAALDASGGSPGLDNAGAGGSYVSGDIIFSGRGINQSPSAAIQTTATTVHMIAGNVGITLNEIGNLFGEMDGSSVGGASIVGLYGIGDGGFAASGSLSLTGWASQPLWIQGAISGTNIALSGDSIQIKDHITALVNLTLNATGAAIQDQLGGGSNINVGGVTNIVVGGDADLSGPNNNFNAVFVGSANSVIVKSVGSMNVMGVNVPGNADFESSSGNLTISGALAGAQQVLLFAGGNLNASGVSISSSAGQVNMAAGTGINLTSSVLSAAGDLDVSTQGGPLIASGANISGVAGNWRTYLSNYAGGGHSFGPFDPLVNADYRQVNGNFGTILGTGNGSLWTDTGGIASGTLAGTTTKNYDGNTSINLTGVGLSGLIFNEPVVNLAGQTGVLANANAGTGKLVTLTGPLSLDGLVTSANGKPTYGYTLASASGNVGTVNAAPVTVTSLTGTREFDGTAIVNANIFNINGLINNETLTLAGAGSISDPNVGANKLVNLGLPGQGGLVLGDGTGFAGNYTLVGGTHLANITRRTQSNWLGGSGLWSSPTSWDVMPTAGNVAGVSIPSGVQVTYDATAGTTQLDRIQSAGRVILAGGNLQVADTLRTFQYGQTGGLLDGGGKLIVENLFGKNGGLINMGGLIDITQASGNLVVGGMRGGNMLLKADNGGISQSAALVTTGVLGAQATQAIVLDNANNNLSGFAAFTSNGNVELVNSGSLDIKGIGAQNGDIKVINTGGVFTSGPLLAPHGKVVMVTNSPMVIGNDGITASGNIDLLATNQTSPGNMLINGNLTSTEGSINLGAANNLVQNSTLHAAGAIRAVAGGSIIFGPLAISSGNPVIYIAGGVPVLSPPSSLAELLARNNGVGAFVNEFLDKFEDALAAREDKDKDALRKKDRGELVVEGETCRP